MSGIHLVASDSDRLGNGPTFSDGVRHLKVQIEQAQTLTDLENLIKHLTDLLKQGSLSSDQKQNLKSLRQKGYDRRAKIRKRAAVELDHHQVSEQRPELDKNEVSDSKSETLACENKSNKFSKNIDHNIGGSAKMQIAKSPTTIHSVKNKTPWDGVKKVILSIDGEKLARKLPSIVALTTMAIAIGGLLWHQSVKLYQASGFSSPGLIAAGGILMVLGFSALHAAYRTKLALLLCFYAGGYEAYFIISGTVAYEAAINHNEYLEETSYSWLNEQVSRLKNDYEKYKTRYEDQSSKNYQNGWYKKNFLDPAWKKYSESQKDLSKIMKSAETAAVIDHTGWLKIFYRLGLVSLLMLITHRALNQICVKT